MLFRSLFKDRSLLVLSVLVSIATSAHAAEEISVTDIPVGVEKFQFGASTSYHETTGRFDPYGYYTSIPDGASARTVGTGLSGSYRFNKQWEADLMLPIRQTDITVPTGTMSSTSVGGTSVEGRYHYGGWSHLTFHVATTTPWQFKNKTSTGDPSSSLASVMGNDSSAMLSGSNVRVGAGVSHTFRSFRAAMDLTTTVPFATEQEPTATIPVATSVRKGERIQTSEGVSYLLGIKWSFSTSVKQMWGRDTTVDGLDQVGTASRSFSTALSVGYGASRDWHWMASYETLYPFYNYAVNQGCGPSVSIGMTYMNL